MFLKSVAGPFSMTPLASCTSAWWLRLPVPRRKQAQPGLPPFLPRSHGQPPPAAAPEDDTSGKVTRGRRIGTCKASKAFISQAPPGTTGDVRSIHFSRGHPSRRPTQQQAAAERSPRVCDKTEVSKHPQHKPRGPQRSPATTTQSRTNAE